MTQIEKVKKHNQSQEKRKKVLPRETGEKSQTEKNEWKKKNEKQYSEWIP